MKELAKVFSLKLSGTKDFVLKNNTSQISFSIRHNKVTGKNWEQELSVNPALIKGQLCVPLDFGDRALGPLLGGKVPKKWNDHLQYIRFAQVVIDPGHGGNDWGAQGFFKGDTIKEKNLTLEFSRELSKELKNKNIEAVQTRNQDDFVALSERYALANTLKPKLFISLHLNTAGISRGFEIFTLSTFHRDRKSLLEVGKKVESNKDKSLLTFKSAAKQEISVEWAAVVKDTLKEFLPPVTVGMRRFPFFLLYAVSIPAVLIELGHLDREEDNNFWLNPTKRKNAWEKLSNVIAQKLSTPHKL